MGKIGNFWMANGYFYRGELEGETPTHYKISDFKTGGKFDLLKTSVERVRWEVE